ncbi:MAG: class I SAM-dependent methyltransferase [Bacteroidota bacterium]
MASIIQKIATKLNLYSKDKEATELRYWKIKKQEEKQLNNTHYQYFYTEHFGLTNDFYKDKKILDIGCGPRGSLEWADMARERVGLDPLANEYLRLGANEHKMRYLASYSEDIPLDDYYFDVVCSFNSIDHVEDLPKTCSEIDRVLKPGGTLLLLVDIHDHPTICEPQIITWDFMKVYFSMYKILAQSHYEKKERGMYESVRKQVLFDHQNSDKRYGILSVMAKKS